LCLSLVLIVLASCAYAINIPSLKDCMNDEEFQQFIMKYNKAYSSPEDFVQRCMIFNSNLARMKTLNNRKSSFTTDVYEWADMTREEFERRYLGSVDYSKMPFPHATDPLLHEHANLAVADDDAFRWPDNIAGPPLDQGQCESCFDFAGLNQVASAVANTSGTFVELAEQEILDCGYDTDACHHGGNAWNVFRYAKDKGVCPRSSYRNYDCVCNGCPARPTGCQPVFISNMFSANPGDITSIKQAVSIIPVTAAFFANDDFQNYRGGVFQTSTCPSGQTNHLIMITGWGTDNGLNYWWVKNSWGGNWGEAGYVRFLMGSNMCGMESYVSYSTK